MQRSSLRIPSEDRVQTLWPSTGLRAPLLSLEKSFLVTPNFAGTRPL